jgi:hypothetical protein
LNISRLFSLILEVMFTRGNEVSISVILIEFYGSLCEEVQCETAMRVPFGSRFQCEVHAFISLLYLFNRESEDTALMILKELYSLIGVTSCKIVDAGHTQQTVATFPRPPTAVQSSPGSHVPPTHYHQTAGESYGEPVLRTAQAFTSEIPVPQPASFSVTECSLTSVASPVGPAASVGPPPKTGFVRK